MSRGVRQKVRSYKIFLTHFLREASKNKSAVLNDRAIKRRGGGGKGGRNLKEKKKSSDKKKNGSHLKQKNY